jgi:hypothetical protein
MPADKPHTTGMSTRRYLRQNSTDRGQRANRRYVRTYLAFLLIASLVASPSRAQPPIEGVSPRAAFAGGPIHLSARAETRLRAHFHGDNVPLIPAPFRTRLDTALAARDWRQIDAAKKVLIQARDLRVVLLWDQTRFLATGDAAVAAAYARDLAGSDVPDAEQAAAAMWLYAIAATFTDGHKCTNPEAKEAYLATLLGSDFDAVKGIIRSMPDDRLAAMRDNAIQLESILSTDRTDDTICRTTAGRPETRPEDEWQRELAPSRTMLPRNLTAICSVVRKKESPRAGK